MSQSIVILLWFTPKYFEISIMISSLIHELFRSVILNFLPWGFSYYLCVVVRSTVVRVCGLYEVNPLKLYELTLLAWHRAAFCKCPTCS